MNPNGTVLACGTLYYSQEGMYKQQSRGENRQTSITAEKSAGFKPQWNVTIRVRVRYYPLPQDFYTYTFTLYPYP